MSQTKEGVLLGLTLSWVAIFWIGLFTDLYDFVLGVAIALGIADVRFVLARIWRVPMSDARRGHSAVMRTLFSNKGDTRRGR